MAKQTFTTGQVLTASQMTSLQQTAMGGGSATAKTTSYVLVAADAGGTVIMNAAGSTTITVNTSLFAAGDTVLIVNTGAGTCTVTANTATVSTAGSLALTQYESGILYFTATGAAIFNDYVQASSNPLTTTGDMIYSSSGSTQARLGIGSTSQVLTVASGVPSWATSSAGGMTLISTTSLTGSSISLTSIPATYYNLQIIIRNYLPASNNMPYIMTLNNDTTANRYRLTQEYATLNSTNQTFNAARWDIDQATSTNTTSQGIAEWTIPDYANTTTWKIIYGMTYENYDANNFNQSTFRSIYNQTAAISSIQIAPQSGNFTSGTVLLYGVK